jgi:hypothetical protein
MIISSDGLMRNDLIAAFGFAPLSQWLDQRIGLTQWLDLSN